jgi:hypothetical protein
MRGAPLGTHEKQSAHNPRQHPMLAQQSGRLVYFEGTSTNTVTSHPVKTPRDDYKQVVYRLDLADIRLKAFQERDYSGPINLS